LYDPPDQIITREGEPVRIQAKTFLSASTLAGLLLTGCVSTSTAPPSLGPEVCTPDPELVGTWKSSRSSQLGPASMTFRFHCDCTYLAKTRLFLIRGIHENGAYWVEDGQISMSRATGEVTTWAFELDGDRLLLEEHENETHAYERKARGDCP
jgi:hypothetical protein